MSETFNRAASVLMGLAGIGSMAGVTFHTLTILTAERAINEREHEAARQDRAEVRGELDSAKAEIRWNREIIVELLGALRKEGSDAKLPLPPADAGDEP